MFARRIVSISTAMVGLVLMFSLVSHLAAQDKKDDVSGTYTWTSQGFGGEQAVTLKVKQDGDKITGTISGFQGDDQIQEGTFKDGTLTFKVSRDFGQGRPIVTLYTCKISGDTIKGKGETIIAQEIDGKKSK